MSFGFKSDRPFSSQTGFQTEFFCPIPIFVTTLNTNFTKARVLHPQTSYAPCLNLLCNFNSLKIFRCNRKTVYFFSLGRFSIPQKMCSVEVTSSTPISMFLPANSGYGRCALSLNKFLVTLHNDFIDSCKRLLKDESR